MLDDIAAMRIRLALAVSAVLFMTPQPSLAAPPHARSLPADDPGLPTECRGQPMPRAAYGEAHAIDGSTVAVAGVGPRLRLWGIQVFAQGGKAARAGLDDLLRRANHQIRYEPVRWDRSCGVIAVLTVKNHGPGEMADTDLGLALLKRGLVQAFGLDDVLAGRSDMSRAYAEAEAMARENRIGLWPGGWNGAREASSGAEPRAAGLDRGTSVATLEVTSVSVEAQGPQKRGGWNAGDKVVIRGHGFTPHENRVFCTDGQAEDFLLSTSSSDGNEISFLLPDGFYAPFGTGIMIKNANGVASTIPAGERRNY